QPHDILLEHLTAAGNVQLVARLHDPEAVGNTDTTYLHVFVPDLHLVSDEGRRTYQYGFDWRAGVTALHTPPPGDLGRVTTGRPSLHGDATGRFCGSLASVRQ